MLETLTETIISVNEVSPASTLGESAKAGNLPQSSLYWSSIVSLANNFTVRDGQYSGIPTLFFRYHRNRASEIINR